MGRKTIAILTVLAFLTALLAVTVPVALRIRALLEQERTVSEVREQMAALEGENLTRNQNLARWYNRNLTLENPEPGFRAAYDSIFNLGQGRMGLLEVPELKLALPITHGMTGQAGHDPASPLPIRGQGNHIVIFLEENQPFAEGMTVYIVLPGETLDFSVQSIQIMPEGWCVDCPSPAEMLILVVDRGGRRTIVRCVRISHGAENEYARKWG